MILGEPGHESVLYPGADYQAGGGWESGWITCVIPVMVAPDDAVDGGRRYAGGVEDLRNAIFNGRVPFVGGDAVIDWTGEIFPVFADAKS